MSGDAFAPWAGAALLLVAAASAAAQDAYPADITPPAGTRYPCALTPLPRGLPGIPEADREFINRTYGRVLRATQAKLVVLKALDERTEVGVAVARYRETTDRLLARQRIADVPAGLEPFQRDVVAALELQLAFFAKASALRAAGASMEEAYRLAEGRQASARLVAAWSKMQARYPAWPPETRDSIYHHLCALDLF